MDARGGVGTRLLFGIVLVAAFLLLAWLDCGLAGGPMFHAFIGLVMVGGLLEFYAMAARRGAAPLRLMPIGLVVGFVVADYALRVADGNPLGGPGAGALAGFYAPTGLAVAVAVGLVAVAHVLVREPGRWAADAPVTTLGLLYVWFLGAHIFAIRSLGPTPRAGMACVVVFLAAAKLGDSGAYFVGTRWGRHRLAPRTSPNKTVEGALGGLAASVVASLAVAALLRLEGSGGFWALFGLAVGAAGQMGDLVESAVKRSAGVKDSGSLVPTFGGMLDLIDSPLLSAPVALWLLA